MPPTTTTADQDTHATVTTAKAPSDPTRIPGTAGEPGRLTEELDKPTADASRQASVGNVLTAGQSASSDPGPGDDGARPTRRSPPRLLAAALASAARRLRHHLVITSLVVLVAVIIGGAYIFWLVSQSQLNWSYALVRLPGQARAPFTQVGPDAEIRSRCHLIDSFYSNEYTKNAWS